VPIGGEGAHVGDILPESLHIKGRVDYKAMQSFVKQVHRSSTSRAVTLVHISSAPSGGDDAEAAMAKIVKQYRERKRCGVAKTEDGIELYLAPRGQHADKVILTVDLIPGHVPPSTGMIGMVIHPRGIGPRKVDSKELHRSKKTRVEEHVDEDEYAPNAPPAQFMEVPPPPPPSAQMAPLAAPQTLREVPPPPPPAAAPPAFQAQDLAGLIATLSGAQQPVRMNVPPPPPPP
jgi:hypothetical protein